MSRIAIALVSISMVASASAAYGEPCNPVVDGTYCATQMTNSRAQPSGSAYRFQPIDGLGGSLLSGSYDQPATLGAITFNADGSRCIGLLRRASCK